MISLFIPGGREAGHVASQDRRRKRLLQLTGQARKEFALKRVERAVQLQGEAVELCRAMARAQPDDPVHRQSAASALYSMGGFLSSAGRAADALRALDESAELYRSIDRAPGMPETAPLIADVGMRRALACADDGRGATAVTEAAAAVAAYQALAAQIPAGQRSSGHPVLRGLARVYSSSAAIMARFGDPDMAVGSADRGIRIYMSDAGTGVFGVAEEDVGYLVSGTSVAAVIHALHGRIDISLVAAQVATKFSGLPEWQLAMRSAAEQVQRMSAEHQAEFGRRVVAAMRQGTPDGAGTAPVTGEESAVSATAQCLAVLRQAAGYPARVPGPGDLELVTLAGALARAGQDELAALVTRPAVDCAFVVPADRCDPQLAPAYAWRLAEQALEVLPAAEADGIRLALEAHYLYAAASSRQVPAMRHQFADFGPAWARALLTYSAVFERRAEMRMALDLASWAAGVAAQLVPLTALDLGLAPLARDCIEQHAAMLRATGDPQGADAALATLRQLGLPPD